MPILRRPQRIDAAEPVDEEVSPSVPERSGAYRVGEQRRETVKMWARPTTPTTPTLPSMHAVRPATAIQQSPSASADPRRATQPGLVASNTMNAEGAPLREVGAGAPSPTYGAPRSMRRADGVVDVAPNHPGSSVRRTGTLRMHAVRPFEDVPPPPSPRMLDDLDFLSPSHPPVALELGALPAGHVAIETIAGRKVPRSVRFASSSSLAAVEPEAPVALSSREMPAVAPTSSGRTPASGGRMSGPAMLELEPMAPAPVCFEPALAPPAPLDPRPGIVAFAGFGIPPENLTDMPAYALRVIARKRVLRAGLTVARAHRPQDVALYEAALECANGPAAAKGIALLVTVVAAGIAAVVAAVGFVV